MFKHPILQLQLQEGLEYEAVSEFKHWEKVGSECKHFHQK